MFLDNRDPSIRYERVRVRRLMVVLGLEKSLKLIWDRHQYRTGKPGLTFVDFDHCFPTFPWKLASQVWYSPLPSEDERVSLRYWMERFTSTIVWHTYQTMLDYHEQSEGTPAKATRVGVEEPRPCGLLFSFQGIRGGLILHNSEPQTTGSYFVFHHQHYDGTLRRYVVERYSGWLQAIAKRGWTPDSEPVQRQRVVVAARKPPSGAGVHAWMVKLLGIGPDTLVLAWLFRVLACSKLSPYAKRFRSPYNGLLCAKATHARIANDLGLSPRQVRSGLTRLRNQKFIRSEGSYIYLDLDEVKAARKKLSAKPR